MVISVYQASPTFGAMGKLGLFNFMAIVVFSIISGELADKVINVSTVLKAILVCFLFICILLMFFPGESIALLFFSAFVVTSLRIIRTPFYFKMSQFLLKKLKNPGSAQRKYVLSWQLTAIVSPILGSIVSFFWGVTSILLLSILMIGSSAILILKIQYVQSRQNKKKSVFSGYRETFRFYFYTRKIIKDTFVIDTVGVLFASITALLPFLLEGKTADIGTSISVIKASQGIGMIIPTLFIHMTHLKEQIEKYFYWSILCFCLAIATAPFMPNIYALIGVFFLIGIFDGVSVLVREYLLLWYVPKEIEGKAYSLNSIFITTSDELGEFESTTLAGLVGLTPSIFIGVGVCLSVALFMKLQKKGQDKFLALETAT